MAPKKKASIAKGPTAVEIEAEWKVKEEEWGKEEEAMTCQRIALFTTIEAAQNTNDKIAEEVDVLKARREEQWESNDSTEQRQLKKVQELIVANERLISDSNDQRHRFLQLEAMADEKRAEAEIARQARLEAEALPVHGEISAKIAAIESLRKRVSELRGHEAAVAERLQQMMKTHRDAANRPAAPAHLITAMTPTNEVTMSLLLRHLVQVRGFAATVIEQRAGPRPSIGGSTPSTASLGLNSELPSAIMPEGSKLGSGGDPAVYSDAFLRQLEVLSEAVDVSQTTSSDEFLQKLGDSVWSAASCERAEERVIFMLSGYAVPRSEGTQVAFARGPVTSSELHGDDPNLCIVDVDDLVEVAIRRSQCSRVLLCIEAASLGSNDDGFLFMGSTVAAPLFLRYRASVSQHLNCALSGALIATLHRNVHEDLNTAMTVEKVSEMLKVGLIEKCGIAASEYEWPTAASDPVPPAFRYVHNTDQEPSLKKAEAKNDTKDKKAEDKGEGNRSRSNSPEQHENLLPPSFAMFPAAVFPPHVDAVSLKVRMIVPQFPESGENPLSTTSDLLQDLATKLGARLDFPSGPPLVVNPQLPENNEAARAAVDDDSAFVVTFCSEFSGDSCIEAVRSAITHKFKTHYPGPSESMIHIAPVFSDTCRGIYAIRVEASSSGKQHFPFNQVTAGRFSVVGTTFEALKEIPGVGAIGLTTEATVTMTMTLSAAAGLPSAFPLYRDGSSDSSAPVALLYETTVLNSSVVPASSLIPPAPLTSERRARATSAVPNLLYLIVGDPDTACPIGLQAEAVEAAAANLLRVPDDLIADAKARAQHSVALRLASAASLNATAIDVSQVSVGFDQSRDDSLVKSRLVSLINGANLKVVEAMFSRQRVWRSSFVTVDWRNDLHEVATLNLNSPSRKQRKQKKPEEEQEKDQAPADETQPAKEEDGSADEPKKRRKSSASKRDKKEKKSKKSKKKDGDQEESTTAPEEGNDGTATPPAEEEKQEDANKDEQTTDAAPTSKDDEEGASKDAAAAKLQNYNRQQLAQLAVKEKRKNATPISQRPVPFVEIGEVDNEHKVTRRKLVELVPESVMQFLARVDYPCLVVCLPRAFAEHSMGTPPALVIPRSSATTASIKSSQALFTSTVVAEAGVTLLSDRVYRFYDTLGRPAAVDPTADDDTQRSLRQAHAPPPPPAAGFYL